MEMMKDKEYLDFISVGTEKQRAYYIPFAKEDTVQIKNRIIDRNSSSRFMSLNGSWDFGVYNLQTASLKAQLKNKITVPGCVQAQGYDQIQYLNERYPICYDPPYVPTDTPVFHYRDKFFIDDLSFEYYINFEGVDSGFYLYINGKKVGFGQISHATNEFNITKYLTIGKNRIDVFVLKYSAGTYLECQDKFRLSGIFRDVYILKRPKKHITDYKINTYIKKDVGIIEIVNESDIEFSYKCLRSSGKVKPNEKALIEIKNAKIWSSETPYLYTLTLYANGEKIPNKVGIRTVSVENGIFKINGQHIKLKGVNRHEFHCEKGYTLSVEDTVHDLKILKWANVNAIRTAHYPDMPEFYELCDAYGFYVVDEADVETHGIFNVENNLGFKHIIDATNIGIYDDGVFSREVALLERDKNRTCVVIWSLGNECSWGKMFYQGADYIRKRDMRPIHYQGVETLIDKTDYYTDKIDIVGKFYPPLEFFDEYLNDEKEKRPLLIPEYLHAMGNSCGGLKEYWEKINTSDRIIGAFVWEFNDHAFKRENGFLYGGDFGEREHDLNFCVDGLVTPDRKIKSNILEVKAMYETLSAKETFNPTCQLEKAIDDKCQNIKINEYGDLLSIGKFKFELPLKINVLRAYIDNDNPIKQKWQAFENYKTQVYGKEVIDGATVIKGKVVANVIKPIMDYVLIYKPINNGVDISLEYKVADFIEYLPRIGLEFAIAKKHKNFTYKGYGPTESYVDKHLSSSYGEYSTSVTENFSDYIKPQECGSHFNSTKIEIKDSILVTAEKAFSFSVLPYTTKELISAKHSFELDKPKYTVINLDVAMSGVGTASCGPKLPTKYQAQKQGKNIFRIELL